MNKTIRFISFLLIGILSFSVNSNVGAQTKRPEPETMERLFAFWSMKWEQVKFANDATEKEFGVFNRFYSAPIDSMEKEFSKGVFNGTINLSNIKEYMNDKQVIFNNLFIKFRDIEKSYPSSVDEYKIPHKPRLGADSCFANCTNTDFEDGNFTGWYGYYGINNSSTTAFNITGITGGYLGAVSKAAQDPNTGNTYQLRITSGAASDWFLNTYSTYSVPQVSPYGGKYSVMLGDSINNGKGTAILTQTFKVASLTSSLTYQYAVFLEEPTPHHLYYQQAFFSVAVIDQNGDTIPGCGSFNQNALYGYNSPGFHGTVYTPRTDTIYWKGWSIVNVPLKNYVGQCVTVVFQVQDCQPSGHCGYAYVDASCTPNAVISSSTAFCGQDSISLTAPPGWASYRWSGNPSIGILGNDTLQTIYVDSAGTYQVIMIGGNNQCTDTLTIKIGKALGPVPKPSFHADTICAGQSTTFTNTSNPIVGATFYWDFYNIGTYQDSLITNPTWIYSTPGTYTVKLHEVYNGCGADTLITVTVLPSVAGGFNFASTTCAPATITFNNTSVGATSYYWNYGDPASNPNDTSTILINGSHTYTVAGTYTVTLVAKNGGPCPDTIRQVVTILGVPVAVITGGDSVCNGGVDTLTASGGTSYFWNTGATTSSITVSPVSQTVYLVTVTNACGAASTTFTVSISAPPIALLSTAKDSICSGDTVKLTAGGGSYVWSTGATTSTINVVPLVTTTYTLHVFTPSTTCQDSAMVTIYVTPSIKSTIAVSSDTVCPGGSVTLTVSSSSGPPSYIWNTGATTSSITVNPAFTTTYYVITAGKCANDSIGQVITVVPTPTVAITSSDTVCKGTPVTVTASGATTYLWSNGSTTNPTTITINSDSTISVIGSNGGCKDSIKKRIKIYSGLVVTTSRDTVCSGAGKAVISVSPSGGHSPYTYAWNNGITWDSAGPLTVTPPPYQYICTITDGCGDISIDTVNVVVRPAPAISFYPTPDTIDGGGFVNFVNLTGGNNTYYWTLGDGSTSSDTTPFHEYNIAGTYIVTLVATNQYGCTDTLTKDIYVIEQIVVPNVFTPNGDGVNDVLHIRAGSMQTFNFQIFNRWGQKIFETNNPNIDWTGRSSSGVMETDGTYYYVLDATDYAGKNFKLDGYIQLIR